jgi:hypothetical protein
MLNQKLFDEISARLGPTIAGSPAADLEKNLRALLQSVLGRLDLASREEFDIQREVLLKTRAKLESMEARMAALENRADPGQG